MHPRDADPELPAVDERLVAPETRFEIEDGRVVYVPPADPPHATAHASLAAILLAHRRADFDVAVDMLTRTSKIADMAPDASVFPAAPDPVTGGRQLEHLAFEIVSTETLAHAGSRAADFQQRGVGRVFAIDVTRQRVLEWSRDLDAWSMLDRSAAIGDPCLAVAIPVQALVDSTLADTSVARALRQQRHPEFLAERAEGHAEGHAEGRAASIVTVLIARGLAPTAAERERILAERDPSRLERWLTAALTSASVAELLAGR